MAIINKVIHRFVKPRSEYEENGKLFYTPIPYNVQAYSYELVDNGNPENPDDYIVRYVLGTGVSTYLDIAEGRGKDKEGNLSPALSREYIVPSESQLHSIILATVASELSLKLDKVNAPSVVYGTDKDGNQTTYSKEDFGKVDDVQLNGTSIVENKIANLEPEASDIAYTNDQYPTMTTLQDAMDKLLYIEPFVTLFTGGSNKEKGESVSSIDFKWSYNKKMVSQSINQGIGSLDIALTSYTYTPASPITSNITFTLTANDGTKNCSRSTHVSFYNSYYYGTTTKASLTNEEILSILTKKLTCDKAIRRTYTKADLPIINEDYYAYLVFPTSDCANIKFTEGFPTNDYLLIQRDITSSTGYTQQYNIYRFHNASPYDGGAEIILIVS